MKRFSQKSWCICFITVTCILLFTAAGATFYADPLFHYRAPAKGFDYVLNDERLQNDGILRHFEYDGVILGTSMTQQFMVSEANDLFQAEFVKVSLSGGTFKEIANQLDRAFATREIRFVIRDIFDVSASMVNDKEAVPTHYTSPSYLYNDDPFDDLSYLLNFDVLARYTVPLYFKRIIGVPGGITAFDNYETWENRKYQYGKAAFPHLRFKNEIVQTGLSEEDTEVMKNNLEQNVLRFAQEHQDTVFYLFVPPYSIVKWGEDYREGKALQRIEMEKAGLAALLAFENIRVFSFNTDLSIIANLDNYCNNTHYGKWMNSYILKAMATDDERYRITAENLEEYIKDLQQIYLNYDYESLNTSD